MRGKIILPRPQDRRQRSAPVLGRSKPGRRGRNQVFQGLFALSRCCARGRAHSAFIVYPTVSPVNRGWRGPGNLPSPKSRRDLPERAGRRTAGTPHACCLHFRTAFQWKPSCLILSRIGLTGATLNCGLTGSADGTSFWSEKEEGIWKEMLSATVVTQNNPSPKQRTSRMDAFADTSNATDDYPGTCLCASRVAIGSG